MTQDPQPLAGRFSPEEIEAGRKLFAADWRFAVAAACLEVLPPSAGLEIALAGRSNVGKSSLINALTGRKALARTSHTPGRTQELIVFVSGRPLSLVDMPGYGYAAAPKAKIASWTRLIAAYLGGRSNLARVYVLIDARHGVKPVDMALFDTLDRTAASYQIVLTKADQISKATLGPTVAAVRGMLERRPAAFPEIVITSARIGLGIAELRAAIARLEGERLATPT
jgi:GTP-binding protein